MNRLNINIDDRLEKVGLKNSSTGVAFSGGGAKGFAHIGVIMAFESYGIKPDIISGVSAGSIASVLYASGLEPRDMIKCFTEANSFNDFTEFTLPKEGIFRLNRFARLLESWLSVKYLEELNIPTVIGATNFDKGTSVAWSKGEIVPRVIASCSIPIIFPPVEINGVHYVDGGVLRNLPAWAIRKYCTRLIGCNCAPLGRDYKYKDSIINIALRSYQLMSKSNVLQDLALCDMVIAPTGLSAVGTFNLSEIRNVVSLGYEAACRELEKISKK